MYHLRRDRFAQRTKLALCFALFTSLLLTVGIGVKIQAGAYATARAESAQIDWPVIELTAIPGGYSSPVHVTHAGDGSGRLFIVERNGVIRILKDGAVLDTPFLDIKSRVTTTLECGLLSVAFPPEYASKSYFFVYYNSRTNRVGEDEGCDTVIERFRVTNNPDVADSTTEEVILEVDQPYNNHNGGQIAFGRDGYLYIGLGDGGSGGDPLDAGQTKNTLLGKMLRIEVGESGTFTVPTTNPFVNNAAYRSEIWALGLRNPWRFSFDRANGDLYIGDVGQGSREEIDYQPGTSAGGENYGWRIMEGTRCFRPASECDQSGLTLPIHDYGRTEGNSVTGGVVARTSAYPRMNGVYFYADFGSGRIWGLQRDGNGEWQNRELDDTTYSIASFGEDEVGNVYVVDLGGAIYQITDPAGTFTPRDFIYLPILARDSSGTASLSDLDWDPRLDQRMAVFKPAQVAAGTGYWRLIRARWFNTEESEGRHHIFVDTLDADGNRQTDVPILIRWPDGNHTITTEAKSGEPWATNFDMHSIAPAYEAYPNNGAPADRVDGMGMGEIDDPFRAHHTSYGLTWQWTIAGGAAATLTATAQPTATTAPTVTPTPSLTATTVPTGTKDETPSPTPTASSTATLLTPIATPTIAPTSTPSATPTVAYQFMASQPVCVTDAHSIRLEGTVRIGGQPAADQRVVYDFQMDNSPVAVATTSSTGFYTHIIGVGQWIVWMVNANGNQISTVAHLETKAPGSGCNVVTVDFTGQVP